MGSTGAISVMSGQPSPVSLSAAKGGSYPATITAGYPTATPSSLSLERKEPYQHSPRALTSEERARQGQQSVTQSMLRYGHPATHSQMSSPSPFGDASREYLPAHMKSERAAGRESFLSQNLQQSPPIVPPLRQETSGSSSQYQSTASSSLQQQDDSSRSSARSSLTPGNLGAKGYGAGSSFSDNSPRPSLPPISSIAFRPSENLPTSLHGTPLSNASPPSSLGKIQIYRFCYLSLLISLPLSPSAWPK